MHLTCNYIALLNLNIIIMHIFVTVLAKTSLVHTKIEINLSPAYSYTH